MLFSLLVCCWVNESLEIGILPYQKSSFQQKRQLPHSSSVCAVRRRVWNFGFFLEIAIFILLIRGNCQRLFFFFFKGLSFFFFDIHKLVFEHVLNCIDLIIIVLYYVTRS